MFKAYDESPLNQDLLYLCTAWQMRTIDGVVTPNDHSDEAYDGRVLDRFAEFDLRADPICADLSGALARFSLYRVRLADALTRARSGAWTTWRTTSSRTTPSGSSCTRTCWRRWASPVTENRPFVGMT